MYCNHKIFCIVQVVDANKILHREYVQYTNNWHTFYYFSRIVFLCPVLHRSIYIFIEMLQLMKRLMCDCIRTAIYNNRWFVCVLVISLKNNNRLPKGLESNKRKSDEPAHWCDLAKKNRKDLLAIQHFNFLSRVA